MGVQEVVSEIESDIVFFDESGGGVTLSGGEPLFQPEFATALLSACQHLRIHTALDTCGFAPWEHLSQVARVSDLVLYDLKHIDIPQHVRWTRQSSDIILDNLVRLDALKKRLWIRIPFIPGFNDDLQSWHALAAFVAQLRCVEAIHLLPYHRAGEGKWRQLERLPEAVFCEPEKEAINAAVALMRETTGCPVHVGG